MKSVLLTGSTGFVGSYTIPQLLKKGYTVHAVTSKSETPKSDENLIWHTANLLDSDETENLLKTVCPTHLLHFAWYVEHGKFWTSTENVAWVYRSFELLKSFAENGGKRAVLIGSCTEYDWTIGDFCDENETPLKPSTLYGAAKRSLFELASIYAANVGLSLSWARLFFMFGAGEPEAKLVAYLIKSLLKGERAFCKNPDLVRDYLYVNEVAEALTVLLEQDICGAINVASGKPLRIRDLAETIGKITGRQDKIEFVEKVGASEPAFVVANTKRLTEETGWKPKYSLETALREYAKQIL